jgi:cation diffusion facilitator family transporter
VKNYKIKRKAALISLLVGIGMFLAKTTAYFITESTAIFSDAAESVVHILATSMALYSIILSAKPADDSHPYGHGNVEYFSAAIEGLLIIIAAVFIIHTSITAIIAGPHLRQLDIGIIIITAAGFVNLALGFYLVSTGRKTNSLTLIADGKHVLTDSYTSIGVMAGIILVMITGFEIIDPVVAIAVAVNIIFTGFSLIKESVSGLMVANKPDILQSIADKLVQARKNYWIDIHELRFWKSGDSVFIDFHLIFPFYFNIMQSHSEERIIKDSLKDLFPESQVKIHFDFCTPELCKFCSYSECPSRTSEYNSSIKWDVPKLSGKPVYQIYK